MRWLRFHAVHYWGFFRAVFFSVPILATRGQVRILALEWAIVFHRSWQIDNHAYKYDYEITLISCSRSHLIVHDPEGCSYLIGGQILINVFEFPIFSASWYFSNKYFPNQTFSFFSQVNLYIYTITLLLLPISLIFHNCYISSHSV